MRTCKALAFLLSITYAEADIFGDAHALDAVEHVLKAHVMLLQVAPHDGVQVQRGRVVDVDADGANASRKGEGFLQRAGVDGGVEIDIELVDAGNGFLEGAIGLD